MQPPMHSVPTVRGMRRDPAGACMLDMQCAGKSADFLICVYVCIVKKEKLGKALSVSQRWRT